MKKQIIVFSTIFAMAALSFVSLGAAPAIAAQEDFTTAASFSPANPDVGEVTAVTVDITNNGPDMTGLIVDLEIYDSSNVRVFQDFTELGDRNFPSGTTGHLDYEWTPGVGGMYTAKVGVFTSGWASLLHWNNDAGMVTVGTIAGGGNVELTGGDVITPENPTMLSAFFETDSPPSMEVLLDLELYRDSTNEKVAQEFWNNVIIPDSDPFERQLAIPGDLPNGDYTFRVGIFNPDWAGLLNWYNTVEQFTISDEEPPEEGPVALARKSLNPSIISTGESSEFCGQFVSPDSANTVLIDLELYNSSNTKVQQVFFDNVAIAEGGFEVRCMDTDTELPAGEYTVRVGIFNTGWSGLINWYDDVEVLTIE